MASSKDYMEFILDQLSSLDEISYKAMMGEYIIYYQGKIIGGIYDDRFLVKPTKSAKEKEIKKFKFIMEDSMDIWERMYEKAKEQYHPEDVSPFIYAHNVVCAIEADNGEIYTGFCIESCSGVMNLCADRVAALNMYVNSGQTKVKRFIAFRDSAPNGGGSGMPCGACREFYYQLDEANENMEIMVDYEKRETITLKELMPNWWGKERYAEAKKD